jgi:hypothetical protein
MKMAKLPQRPATVIVFLLGGSVVRPVTAVTDAAVNQPH